jgi:hypothetical protein
MRLAGDGGVIESVRFKVDKHTVHRDRTAPYGGMIGRRTLGRTRARSLRAVVELRDGSARPIAVRTLPRCGVKRR